MALVSIRNVNKVYDGGVHAVKNVNLEIKDEEFVVFVGPSGCGKTTTLRMVAGLESITSGDVAIDDTVVNNLPPMDRDIAMVFQNYALYPHMSVRQNMAFGLKMRKFEKSDIEKRVANAAGILGIENLLDRKPRQLSGGQRQRVALGRAIVRDPKVFLFDEPLSNLDAKLRGHMRAELKHMQSTLGTTTIYVTHDQIEAMTLADRIAVMKGGSIQQLDDPHTIYSRPKNRYVAGFIGSPSMNFLKAQVAGTAKAPVLAFAGQNLGLADYAFANGAPIGKAVEFGARPEHINLLRGKEAKGKAWKFDDFVDLRALRELEKEGSFK